MTSLVAQSTCQPVRDSNCVVHGLVEHRAHGAGRGVGDAQPRRACGRATTDTSASLRAVRAPVVVAHVDVVAERRAVEVGRHLQPRDLARVHVDDRRGGSSPSTRVAGQRVLPHAQRRVADRRLDEVHLADVALVLLLRRDLLRVGRPRARSRGRCCSSRRCRSRSRSPSRRRS